MNKQTQIKITPDMMKSFKTVTCDCGGMIFHPGIIIKKISPIISPSGKEEPYPIEVLICNKCGGVPSELNTEGILPDEILAKPVSPVGGKYPADQYPPEK